MHINHHNKIAQNFASHSRWSYVKCTNYI